MKAMLLSMKKSVIYDPNWLYLTFCIVEKPTSVSRANQAFGFAAWDSESVTSPPKLGKDPLT